ncbi:DUF4238 domain-containing protein [Rhizobium laguerreae]|uniref:DUF4238 domain-containing protein n=1 Tax=Rhizobium laguerreae TaxID=1076926 RepID=UPI001441F98C|nr:DUF4238 domain-containing protein [Rhizobium laguerreae]NKM26961.1 DUF4238 domain-containing protein [Rhizobium laguerreae]
MKWYKGPSASKKWFRLKSHYIPQFYLKPWEGADGKLEVFLRRSDGFLISKRLHRKATGYAVDLYKLPGVSPTDEHKMETAFMAPVDDEAVHARDMLLGAITPTDLRTRHAWARFVLSLMIRSPEEVAEFKKSYTNLIMTSQPEFQAKYAKLREEGDPEWFEDWMVQYDATHVERSAMFAITTFIEHPRILNLLQNMHWTVIDISPVTGRFMTSDRPVMLTQGMLQYSGHYALPLSPTRLFLATTTIQFAQQFMRLPASKIVREINKLVVGQARKYVYATDSSRLGFVRRQMGKLPSPTLLAPLIRTAAAGRFWAEKL